MLTANRSVAIAFIFALGMAVVTWTATPAAFANITRPIGTFLAVASLGLFWPYLKPVFNVRKRALNYHLMAGALVLLVMGTVAMPIVRWAVRLKCLAGTWCADLMTSTQVGLTVAGVGLLILAALTDGPDQIPKRRVFIWLGLAFAAAALMAVFQSRL